MKNIAVLMIDMQDFFLKNLDDESRSVLVRNQGEVLDFCLKKNVPVFVFEYKAGGVLRGPTTKVLLEKLKRLSQRVIVKDNNSAFVGTKLEELLKESKVKTILLLGINANGCVQDTAMGAIRRGYKVVTSSDLIASTSRRGLGLSKRNEAWYRNKCSLLASANEVLGLISRD